MANQGNKRKNGVLLSGNRVREEKEMLNVGITVTRAHVLALARPKLLFSLCSSTQFVARAVWNRVLDFAEGFKLNGTGTRALSSSCDLPVLLCGSPQFLADKVVGALTNSPELTEP